MFERAATFSESLFVVCLLCILLIPFAWMGLAMMQTGLNRARGAAHAALSALLAATVALLAYALFGFAVQGIPRSAAPAWHSAGKAWSLVGAGPLFMHGFVLSALPASLTFLFLLFSVALAAIPATSTGAERWRLVPMAISTAFFAAVIFPLFSHWVWGGWLGQLGVNAALGAGTLDPGGSGCIQASAGVAALSIACILGPRLHKFASDGIPNATPGHDAPAVLLGCVLAWIGWMGINIAGAILFAGAQFAQLPAVAVNTTLCAAAAFQSVLWITRVRFGRPDASLSANGCIGGLAASSATALFLSPLEAIVVGLIAGALVLLSIDWIESKLHIDDPAAAISVHGVGGLVGLLVAGLVARPLHATAVAHGQFLAQLLAVAALLGLIFPLALGWNWLLHRVLPQRVPTEGERHGIDLYELGSGAYPEFVTHHEDFTQH